MGHFVDFIGEGRGSRTLREELNGLRRNREQVFQAPPRKWIEDRLTRVQELLERTVDRSGPVLRNLLGQLRLEPMRGDIGRPYYVARTSLNALALLEMPPENGSVYTGSNSLRWWRRADSNRRPPECDSGALPTELRPHVEPNATGSPPHSRAGPAGDALGEPV